MSNLSSSAQNEATPEMWFVEHLTPHDVYHHGIRELLHASRSAYQSITVAEIGAYGRALFLDGKIQTAERDEHLYHQPLVHVPCIQVASPRNVLILGGADGGAAREALRWKSVEHVVVVEIDEQVVDACNKYLPKIGRGSFNSERCQLIIGDALDFVGNCKSEYDVVICDLTDPVEDGPSSNLFSIEFFKKIKACMSERSALSIQVGPASLVESPTLMPRICATLRAAFGVVHPYQIFTPTYGSPLGMAVVHRVPQEIRGTAEAEQLLSQEVEGDLSALDGPAFSALFALPPCTRKAIEEEQEIITEQNTAVAYGPAVSKTK